MSDIPGDGKAVFVLFNHLPEITVEIENAVGKLVRKAAFDIQAMAMANAPVATGFLKSSIYVVTERETTYDSIPDDERLLPPVEQPVTNDEAYVAVGAEYGIYVEYGTSKMAAQPYLTPALEFVRPSFLEAMSRLETMLHVSGIFAGGEVTEE